MNIINGQITTFLLGVLIGVLFADEITCFMVKKAMQLLERWERLQEQKAKQEYKQDE